MGRIRTATVVRHAEAEHADALLILAMAELARRRQEGRLGMSLRDAFAEAGVDCRGGIAESTSRRLRAEPRFVIAHVGRHLEAMTTT